MYHTHTTSFFPCLCSRLPQGMLEEHGCSSTLLQLHVKLHGDGWPDPARLWGAAGDRSKEAGHSRTAAWWPQAQTPIFLMPQEKATDSRGAGCSTHPQQMSSAEIVHHLLPGCRTTGHPLPIPGAGKVPWQAAARAPTGRVFADTTHLDTSPVPGTDAK